MSETTHVCGCITRFDTMTWSSVARHRCDDHVRQEREARAQGQDNTDSPVSS